MTKMFITAMTFIFTGVAILMSLWSLYRDPERPGAIRDSLETGLAFGLFWAIGTIGGLFLISAFGILVRLAIQAVGMYLS
jgi:hypothetical protein